MENQGLLAPEGYWNLSEAEKYEIANGCGPTKATSLVPDSILGISLIPACDIHDYTYANSHSIKKRKFADDLFLGNMCRLLDRDLKPPPLKLFGLAGILFYYLVVRLFGGLYFD